jgi:hypothetical protein
MPSGFQIIEVGKVGHEPAVGKGVEQGQGGRHKRLCKTVNETDRKGLDAQCWWLMLMILATWEAKIRKTEVRGQLGENVHETPSPK